MSCGAVGVQCDVACRSDDVVHSMSVGGYGLMMYGPHHRSTSAGLLAPAVHATLQSGMYACLKFVGVCVGQSCRRDAGHHQRHHSQQPKVAPKSLMPHNSEFKLQISVVVEALQRQGSANCQCAGAGWVWS